MIELKCPSCGSNELKEINGFFVCSYCNTKQKREISDCPSAVIDNKGTVEEMLKRADMYWHLGKRDRASRIYDQVLEIDANNAIALSRCSY